MTIHLLKLGQEWENHRKVLLVKIKLKKSINNNNKNQIKELINNIKLMKTDMISIINDLKLKNEKTLILNEEIKILPKNINRYVCLLVCLVVSLFVFFLFECLFVSLFAYS